MRPGTDHRRGGAAAWLVVVLAVLGLSFLFVSWSTDRQREASASETKRFAGAQTAQHVTSHLRLAHLGTPVTVAIVRETGSATYAGSPETFDAGLARWVTVLRSIGAAPSIVEPAKLSASKADVILIAASPCVGPQTRAAVDTALQQGRGVIMTWLSGIADGGCKPVGFGMLTQLTGASRVDTLESRLDAYITVPAGGPLAIDIPPGSRLELAVANHVALRSAGRDAYWSDYLHNPAPAQKAELLDGAIVRAHRGDGRVVFWGFDLPLVVNDGADGWNISLAGVLVRNSVAWAASLPMASLEHWPRSYVAAAVIAQDVEDEFGNGQFSLDSLRAAGVRGTYFLVSNLAKRNKRLARDMAKYGEVGTHSENHKVLGGTPDSAQTRRLQLTQDDITGIVGKPITGFRPPEEQFDVGTLAAWAAAGGTYVFGANDSRTVGPEVISVGKDTLVLFGRNSNDDFYSVRKLGQTNTDTLAAEYLRAYRNVRELGGLYMLSYHSQMMSTRELVPAVAKIARALAADRGLWLTPAGEIARWWRTRHAIEVSARMIGSERAELTIANPGTDSLTGAVAFFEPPTALSGISTSIGRLLPQHDASIRLELPPLPPRSSMVASITLAPARGALAASRKEIPNAP